MALRKPIQILIEAKDKTAAAFRSVNRQLETAATRVRDIGSRVLVSRLVCLRGVD